MKIPILKNYKLQLSTGWNILLKNLRRITFGNGLLMNDSSTLEREGRLRDYLRHRVDINKVLKMSA